MKNINIIKSILIASTMIFSLQSCDKEDPQEPIAEALVLECSDLVASGAGLTLENRGAGVDYIINCKARVMGDLVINPGVTIEFTQDGALDINAGSIQANGTSEKPILFTGKDKVPGSWGYIVIKSDDVKNKMSYCNVEYAGAFQVNSNGDKGNVIIYNSARLAMDNCTLKHGEEYGIKITSEGAKLPSFINNTITSCKFPVHIPSNLVHNISGGSYIGNTNDVILVRIYGGGTNVTVSNGETHVWTKLDVPYRMAKSLKVQGGTLEINPGVIMEFENGLGIVVGESDASSLVANGTLAQPILFTGVNKIAGSWNKIDFRFTQSPLNSISYATIEYAGSENGAIEMWSDPVLNVSHVNFKNNSSCAFFHSVPDFNPSAQVINPNLTWSNLTYENNSNGNSQTEQTNFPGGPASYCH